MSNHRATTFFSVLPSAAEQAGSRPLLTDTWAVPYTATVPQWAWCYVTWCTRAPVSLGWTPRCALLEHKEFMVLILIFSSKQSFQRRFAMNTPTSDYERTHLLILSTIPNVTTLSNFHLFDGWKQYLL